MTDTRTREQASPLAWSFTAMSDALSRLAAASAASLPQAVAAATEAAWWVTVRLIRGQLGCSADPADFFQPPHAPDSDAAQWTWSAIALPPPPRGKAREASPYREYRTQLAGRSVTQILERAASFLAQTHATVSHSGHDRVPATTARGATAPGQRRSR